MRLDLVARFDPAGANIGKSRSHLAPEPCVVFNSIRLVLHIVAHVLPQELRGGAICSFGSIRERGLKRVIDPNHHR